jgi:hypothetical protein
MSQGQIFLVRRDELTHTQVECFDADTELEADQVRVGIDHFAFSANNITYAVFGDSMQYWRFFPAAAGLGCVPVWGFATVEDSTCDGVAVGERLYGYWPMATHAVLRPARVSAEGLSDASPHRADLPPLYNRYTRTRHAAGYEAGREGEYALLRPLFATAWLIDDFLRKANDFGARTVLLSSASSKTACATAFCLARRADRATRIVGATSPARRAFSAGLGVYDEVIAYDELTRLAADEATVYVDFAGDAAFRRTVHEHWRERLAYSCSVGGTHHEALGPGSGLPGPRPTLFFAPSQAQARSAPPPQGLGRAGLAEQIDGAWSAFIARATDGAAPWLTTERRQGAEAIRGAYLDTLHGRADARQGLILSF